jgi:hypothetical protein
MEAVLSADVLPCHAATPAVCCVAARSTEHAALDAAAEDSVSDSDCHCACWFSRMHGAPAAMSVRQGVVSGSGRPACHNASSQRLTGMTAAV